MPLRPDLGGFGTFPLLLLSLCFFMRNVQPSEQNFVVETADDYSGQDQPLRSKFPSWFLQDALLGGFLSHVSDSVDFVKDLDKLCRLP